MYVNHNNEVLLEALTRNRRTRRPPGFDVIAELRKMRRELIGRIEQGRHDSDIEEVRTTLGSDVLIPYGTFLKANGISYELGQRLRNEGKLKVLRVGSKLMVRRGHAKEFVRKLPLLK